MDRFLTTPILYSLLALAGLFGLTTAWQTVRLAHAETAAAQARTDTQAEKAAHAETKAEHAQVLQGLAERTAQVAALVRAQDATYLAESAAADARNRKEIANALAKKDAVIADLRAGRMQLRQEWQCEVPLISTSGDRTKPESEAAASGNAGYARVREESAGELVQIGALADTQVRWLQGELVATRARCAAVPSEVQP